MDGYSITEAASVLGVPTERVWKLLARGVLAGKPEGETGMRVFLHPRPATAATPSMRRPRAAIPPTEPERELSPFRELLTEFRNLTERYGQALLALGESRGEVASLRSRVDLLEARIDLRLPLTTAPRLLLWPAAACLPSDHTSSPPPSPSRRRPDAGRRRGQVDDEDTSGRSRPAASHGALRRCARPRRRSRALPSCRGPKPPRSTGARPRRRSIRRLPRELPAAEVVPPPRKGPSSHRRLMASPTRSPTGWRQPRADRTAPPEAARPAPDARSDTAPAPVEPLDWDAERYTTPSSETDWMASDAWEPEPPPEPAAPSEAIASEQPAVEDEPEAPVEQSEATAEATDGEPEPEDDEPAAVSEGIEPQEIEPQEAVAEEPSEPEETMLWFGRSPDESGAAEMEVVTSAARPAEASIELPGGDELDEALAEMAPIAIEAPETAPPPTPTTPPASATPISSPAAAIPRTTAPPRVVTTLTRPGTTPTAMATGPASRAYRRLRRIFPAEGRSGDARAGSGYHRPDASL